ncbi:hypothetical protein [Clostridium sp.]|uniref:hypothetical protein n=1 Tax=Clostridium sp. TaxID=1506 RepID=UPI001DE9D064|nr:hypothetical protein [Clostridium sp.]MBS5307697.1 hypothetical protein [Clostridium sp.]
MKCVKLLKEDNVVFMLDNEGGKLNLEDDIKTQRYEKSHNVNVKDMVNKYLGEEDNGFAKIICEIEKLVKRYNIDYFMYGDGKNVTQDSLALIYNLKNRNSYIDCTLKVFFSIEKTSHHSIDRIKYMIDFSTGSKGNTYGFEFFKYFTCDNFYEIKHKLESYFSVNDDRAKDIEVIEDCFNNVKNRINYYYS